MNTGYNRLVEVNPKIKQLPWTLDNILFLINYAYALGKQDGMNEACTVLEAKPDEVQP